MEKQPLSLREVQLAEYSILCRLVEYFGKNNIHYILCGGTLLGAVRHNGFIPWDDDIDILVPRDDYEKLKQIYLSENQDINGVKLHLPGEKDSPRAFIRAIDRKYIAYEEKRSDSYRSYLWVDVFPMDHFPDDEKTHIKYLKKNNFYRKILFANTSTKEYFSKSGYYKRPISLIKLFAAKIVGKMIGDPTKIALHIDKIARDMDAKYKTSNHVGDGTLPNSMKDYFEVGWVYPVTKHKFEDGEFNIPVNYDGYLTQFYGDYMTLPPIEEQQGHHYITVYRVDENDY